MDDNTRQVLIALVTGLTGFASGVFVAVIGFDYASRQRRETWEREDGLRQAEASAVLKARWLTDKREVATRFLRDLDEFIKSSVERSANRTDTQLTLNSSGAEIQLIAPELGDLAREAYRVCWDYAAGLFKADRPDGRLPPDPLGDKFALRDRYIAARREFIDAAAAELEN